MKGSPLTIVVIAAVVIIGGSIVTYLLIENAPQQSGFGANQPQNVQQGEPRVPRPNVYEDTEPLPVPIPPLPDNGTSTLPQDKKPRTPQPPSAGGEVVKPISFPPLPN